MALGNKFEVPVGALSERYKKRKLDEMSGGDLSPATRNRTTTSQKVLLEYDESEHEEDEYEDDIDEEDFISLGSETDDHLAEVGGSASDLTTGEDTKPTFTEEEPPKKNTAAGMTSSSPTDQGPSPFPPSATVGDFIVDTAPASSSAHSGQASFPFPSSATVGDFVFDTAPASSACDQATSSIADTLAAAKAWIAEKEAIEKETGVPAVLTGEERVALMVLAKKDTTHAVMELNDHYLRSGRGEAIFTMGGWELEWTCTVSIPEHRGVFPSGYVPAFTKKAEAKRFAAAEAVQWLKAKKLFVDWKTGAFGEGDEEGMEDDGEEENGEYRNGGGEREGEGALGMGGMGGMPGMPGMNPMGGMTGNMGNMNMGIGVEGDGDEAATGTAELSVRARPSSPSEGM